MGERQFKTAQKMGSKLSSGRFKCIDKLSLPERSNSHPKPHDRMKFRGEETTKLVNLIVNGALISVVLQEGSQFGRPLSFLYKNTQPREGPLTATRILPEHISFLTNMYLLVNAANCDFNNDISCWIVEQ